MKTHQVALLVCILSAVIAVWQYSVGQQDLCNIFSIVCVLYAFGAFKTYRSKNHQQEKHNDYSNKETA